MRKSLVVAVTLMLSIFAGTAGAHGGAGMTGGFISGFSHPILGWDHVIAMVAVELWGAFLGSLAIWVPPVVFPLVMAFGGALGVMGFRFLLSKTVLRCLLSCWVLWWLSWFGRRSGWQRLS